MVYYRVHQLKEEGFNISQIARKAGVVRNTAKKYLRMNPEAFENWFLTLETRKKKLDPYQDQILHWLKEHPDLSAAQVYDWLEERLDFQEATEGTVRNFLNELRELHHIPKTTNERIYNSVEELPPGIQGQVDFGQDVLQTADGKTIRVYCIGFVLSHSRFKYVEWLDRPFKTEDVIRSHENAFRFYGGMPEELVYDQDKLMFVTENSGDILLTKQFQQYREFRKFRLYLCRKGDPESKGKIENVIKFVKYNFSKNRTYVNLQTLNDQMLKWLERTGNHKVHQTIKKRPSEVFALEKQHLKRLSSSFPLGNSIESSITRNVQKDNVIKYQGNRYSVPSGTYNPRTANIVYVEISDNDRLKIRTEPGGEVVADHLLAAEKGLLISDPAHKRISGKRSEVLALEVEAVFAQKEMIRWYIAELKKKYPRHMVDQLMVMKGVIQQHPDLIDKALQKAKALNLISANDFRDIVNALNRESLKDRPKAEGWNSRYSHLKAVERSADYYTGVLGGKTS